MGKLIVVDGPACSGKGTLAKSLAEHYGFLHIDSGLYYRAVAWKTINNPFHDAREVAPTLVPADLEPAELRSEEVVRLVPMTACLPEVREAVNSHIRKVIAGVKGAVIDGRAGAYEFPEADVKIFLTARPEARAYRRWLHLYKASERADIIEIFDDLKKRDKRDEEREHFPLQKHPKAVVIDNTLYDQDTTFGAVSIISDAIMGVGMNL